MDYTVNGVLREHARKQSFIAHIALDALGLRARDAPQPLQHRATAVTKVVENQVRNAGLRQRNAGVRADEAGSASYKNHTNRHSH